MSAPTISTKFRVTPQIVTIDREQKGSVRDELPPMVYRVGAHPDIGFYLNPVSETFKMPAKVYGADKMPIQTIIDAYNRESKQMGVLLAGTKGAGKTLLSQILCNRMIKEQGIPVVLVDSPFSGQGFFDFINALGEVIVVFDEFAKVYDDSQNDMLTFFDGSNVQSKRMSIVIENSIRTVSDFMVDRPSRFMFRLTYDKLSKAVVKEMCEDYQLTAEQTRDVQTYAGGVFNLSTDMLKALLNYVVATGSSVGDAINILNVPEVVGFYAAGNTPIKVKAIVDNRTGLKDSSILNWKNDFINQGYINVRRLTNSGKEEVEEDLKDYIEYENAKRKEREEEPLTTEEITQQEQIYIRRQSYTLHTNINRDNVVKRFREETNDWVIGLPNEDVVIVYEELPVLDMEEIIRSL